MTVISLGLIVLSMTGMIFTIFFINKKIDSQMKMFHISSEQISATFYKVWSEIDLLQKQVQFLEKGGVYRPEEDKKE
jgi:type II secretory pathway component PulC